MLSPSLQVCARVRLANRRDVLLVHGMIRRMAEFECLTHLFSATKFSLSSSFFPEDAPLPTFRSFTTFILKVSLGLLPVDDKVDDPCFALIVWSVDLASPISDQEVEAFTSAHGSGRVVAGFVLFFPNYSTSQVKHGFYVEDLFVKEAYRRKGFGRMLLSMVVAQATRMGLGRVEWCVHDWNVNAIKFYEDMRVDVLQVWRIYRLTGEALEAYGKSC